MNRFLVLALCASLCVAASAQDPMKGADADMQKVLDAQLRLGARPIWQLTPEQARIQPTPADAVKAVLMDQNKAPPVSTVVKQNESYPTAGGSQPLRIYTPQKAAQKSVAGEGDGRPVIVYFHGGGWVIADIDTYDSSATALADKTQAIVVSVEYRHAPEFKFPAAHEDSFAAYQWVLAHAKDFGGDPARIAVAGESAGGNLAANVAIMARDKGVQAPVHMLLVYPVAGSDMNTPSYLKNAKAKPLDKPAMAWFVKYALTPQDAKDPRIDLVHANLKDLPAATIITAEIDPLMSEGKQLSDNLKAAGGKTSYRNYQGVTHEFFGLDAVVADAMEAQKFAAKELRESFAMALKPARAAAH